MRRQFNVVALVKGEHRFVYVYDDASRDALLAEFEAQAADAGLTLNWFDAAVLSSKVREQTRHLDQPGATTGREE